MCPKLSQVNFIIIKISHIWAVVSEILNLWVLKGIMLPIAIVFIILVIINNGIIILLIYLWIEKFIISNMNFVVFTHQYLGFLKKVIIVLQINLIFFITFAFFFLFEHHIWQVVEALDILIQFLLCWV